MFALRSTPTLCLALGAGSTNPLVLATCNTGDAAQVWKWNFDGISPDSESPHTRVCSLIRVYVCVSMC